MSFEQHFDNSRRSGDNKEISDDKLAEQTIKKFEEERKALEEKGEIHPAIHEDMRYAYSHKPRTSDEVLDKIAFEENQRETEHIISSIDKKRKLEYATIQMYLLAKNQLPVAEKEVDDALSKKVPIDQKGIADRIGRSQYFKQVIENFEKDFSSPEKAYDFALTISRTYEETQMSKENPYRAELN